MPSDGRGALAGVARRVRLPAPAFADLPCGKKNLTVWILVKTVCYQRYGAQSRGILETEFSPPALRDSGLKKKFQNAIILLTAAERHFINGPVTGMWVADEVADA